ncbi:hypothetical protein CLU79DRAFT_745396 [Phycomyces nitens]|nr:hypothetical protein CLU79DRAFT_745396 [Phycomyces nitens]
MYPRSLLIIMYNFSEEMFYQRALNGCETFGRLLLDPPISICECLDIAYGKQDGPLLVSTVDGQIEPEGLLAMHAEMLETYFSITVSQGSLVSLPILLKDYIPDLDKLPDFLLHLCTEIIWDAEKECLEGISRELGLLYAPSSWLDPCINDLQWEARVQHVLLPAMKFNFRVPKYLCRYIQSLANIAEIRQAFSWVFP